MSTPPLAPRSTFGGVVAVWIVAAVVGVAIGLFVPSEWRAAWLPVALGGCLILSFAVQLSYGRPHRFIQRVASSVVGALVILGVISLGFGLAGVVPG
ncbi:hypothetical protein [Microbacterium xanthum]|uniref:hypothetical protein n=1 Tax=Microbacterium xanthum TaxID=3079794 RepID=UPI002AD2428E|nr:MULTISPECIES: hypothetical protein [unclassified Microbacterium]MDZ8171921.1 hypothetical protein [Microbacterium sp. KSW-48]MDZ8199982.1 hypothetical protein [Microbacterium sp. SSW1-59]